MIPLTARSGAVALAALLAAVCAADAKTAKVSSFGYDPTDSAVWEHPLLVDRRALLEARLTKSGMRGLRSGRLF